MTTYQQQRKAYGNEITRLADEAEQLVKHYVVRGVMPIVYIAGTKNAAGQYENLTVIHAEADRTGLELLSTLSFPMSLPYGQYWEHVKAIIGKCPLAIFAN